MRLWSEQRIAPLFLLAVFVLASSLTIMLNMNRGLFADDDNLWFHLLSYKIVDFENVEAAENKLIDTFKADGASENQVTRLIDKRDYVYNYFVPTVFWTLGRLAVQPLVADLPYEEQLAHHMYAGFWLATAVSFLVFLLVCWRLRLPPAWWHALAWASVLALVCSLLPTPKPPNFMILNDNISGALRSIAHFIVDPSYGFSAFSFTGRNNYIILMLAFFIARWRGSDVLAYALLALTMTWHASMGMLMLLTILIIDLVTRPSLLRRPTILLLSAAATIYYLLIESLWQKVGADVLFFVLPGLVILGLALFILFRLQLPTVWDARLQALRTLFAQHRAATDIALFLAGWAITLPIAALINSGVDSLQSIYFWSQLHIRIFTIWQPALVFFFLLWLLGAAPPRRQASALLVTLFIAGLSLAHLSAKKEFSFIYPVRLPPTASFLEAVTNGENAISAYANYGIRLPDNCYLPEALVYYLLIKDQALGGAVTEGYLARRPKGLQLDCA